MGNVSNEELVRVGIADDPATLRLALFAFSS